MNDKLIIMSHPDIYHNAPKDSAWGYFVKKLAEGRDAKVNGRNSVWSQIQRLLRPAGGLTPRLDIVHLDRGGGTVRNMDDDKCWDFWETDERVPAYDNPLNAEQRQETVAKVKIIPAE